MLIRSTLKCDLLSIAVMRVGLAPDDAAEKAAVTGLFNVSDATR